MAEITLEQVPEKARNLFNKGFGAFERGNLDYAIDLLHSCAELSPGFLQARKYLRAAQVQRFKRSKRGAVGGVIAAAKSIPTYLKATALLKSGKPLPAMAEAERLLSVSPFAVQYVNLFVKAAVGAELPEVAVQTLEVARDHRPNDMVVVHLLGSLYQKLGRTKSARQCFEKLCEMAPNDPAALKALKDSMALDSMSTDGWSEAAESGGSYRDIIKDKKEAELLEKDAKAVKTSKDTNALIAETLEKMEQEPDNLNYRRALARLHVQNRDYDEAMVTLQEALEISGGDPELDAALSSTTRQKFDWEIAQLEKQGDEEAAEARRAERDRFEYENLRDRVKRYPNDPKLRFEWGETLLENDEINEAIQQFQVSQRSPTYRVGSQYHLGRCFREKGQYDMAREQLEAAASQLPRMDDTKKDITYELGVVCEAMGELEQAAGFYKQIYQVDIGYRDIAQKIENVYKQEP